MKNFTSRILRSVMRKRKPAVNYFLAACLSITSVAISYWSISTKVGALPSAPLLAVAVAALLGGAGPGLLATVIGACGLDYFIFLPGTLFHSADSFIRIGVYFLAAFVCGTIVDELRTAYQESECSLLAAEQEAAARKKVIGIVAHDLRNPLMNLVMKIHVLRKYATQDATAEKKLKLCDSMAFSVERMSRIIDDLLDATRIDAGNFTLLRTRCRVDILLEEILPGLQDLGERSKVILQSTISQGVRDLFCDPFRVAQVLSNLIQNAIKHSPPNGTVLVAVKPTGDGICFSVSDNGNGIPFEMGDRIFDAYTTGLMSGADPRTTGAGLGLFISRAIARCHGGKLQYRNKMEGGTEFSFSLPYGAESEVSEEPPLLLQIS